MRFPGKPPGPMPHLPADFYATALARLSAERVGLREVSSSSPPERWLQQLWRHQRIRRGDLKTLEGRAVRVLHPGFWNRTPGPDFQRAVIQLGDDAPLTGDVEIDVGVGGWRGHGHDRNSRYAGVVLHVVWDSPPRELKPPVLALKPFLEAPLAELMPWLDEEAPGTLPPDVLGQCCAPLRELSAEVLAELLQQAARQRLRRKAGEFALRARHAGWEQALWEGLFAALGYRHNVWPLRRLAELVAPGQPSAKAAKSESVNWEARLLGLGGWLPAQLPRGENSGHIRSLWDSWWRERAAFADVLLPPAADGYRDSFGALAENADIQDLVTKRVGIGAVRARIRGNIEIRHSISLQREQREIDGLVTSTQKSLALNTSWTWREVDDPFDPRSGWVLNAQVGGGVEGLLSDTNFLRTYTKAQWFIPVGERDQIILRGEAGLTSGKADALPQDFLFRAGGSNSVRGYDYLKLGVREGNAIVGGRVLGVLSAEYVHWWSHQWGSAVFVDAGDATDSRKDFDFAYGAGAGVRWRSPAGPIAFDIAYGEREQSWRPHFSLAIAF